jgi:SAM-dependent methyltransferase
MRKKTLYYLDFKKKELFVFNQNEDWIENGILKTENGIFPIVNGVLCLLDKRWELYNSFYIKYKKQIDELNLDINVECTGECNFKSVDSFGWQWNNWTAPYTFQQLEEYTVGYTNIEPNACQEIYKLTKVFDEKKDENITLSESVIVEGGCGHGQLIEHWSKKCKYAIGLDLSEAVFAAAQKAKNRSNLDIIQCDLMNLSYIKQDIFDFVYSWGVLHHTPSTFQTMNELSKICKSKGKFSIGIYHKGNRLIEKLALKADMFVRFFIMRLSNEQRYKYCEFMKNYIRKPIIGFIIRKLRLFHNMEGDLDYVSHWNYDFFGGHWYQDYIVFDKYLELWDKMGTKFSVKKRKFGNFINAYKD